MIENGDIVYGTLPVSEAARVCERGGKYFHLALNLPKDRRGGELSATDMDRFGAELEEYEVKRV
jgi:CRISPR-associated protein Csx16